MSNRITQYAKIIEIMQTNPTGGWTTVRIGKLYPGVIQQGTRINELENSGYVIGVDIGAEYRRHYGGCTVLYYLTELGQKKGIVPMIHRKYSKKPRSSTEESIVKKQNKCINKELHRSESEEYRNAEEGKRERGIQIVNPPAIKINRLVRIKNFLFRE